MSRRVREEWLDAKRLTALAHPTRMHILEATDTEPMSPSELAIAVGEPLGAVAYHFRVLHSAGLIELAATERKRGSVQNFYRASRPGWTEFIKELREMVGDEGEASSAGAPR
jgi:DNA-binding transcriptional ArsR family regulator